MFSRRWFCKSRNKYWSNGWPTLQRGTHINRIVLLRNFSVQPVFRPHLMALLILDFCWWPGNNSFWCNCNVLWSKPWEKKKGDDCHLHPYRDQQRQRPESPLDQVVSATRIAPTPGGNWEGTYLLYFFFAFTSNLFILGGDLSTLLFLCIYINSKLYWWWFWTASVQSLPP